MSRPKRIGEILYEMKMVSPSQVKEALIQQKSESHKKLGEILVEKGYVTDKDVMHALAKQRNMKFIDLTKFQVSEEMMARIPRETMEEYCVLPIAMRNKRLVIATAGINKIMEIEDNLKFLFNIEVDCVVATKEQIMTKISLFFDGEEGEVSDYEETIKQFEELETEVEVREEETEYEGITADSGPIINLVTKIIREAVRMRASDIHVEPMEKKLRIRYRVDGVCVEVKSPPKKLQGAVLSRIKIMADMNITEKRKPQDGRIPIKIAGRDLHLRVSALPTNHGESIVMRILDKKAGLVSLSELGLADRDYNKFQSIIKRPNGIFLVTGPTGSGKTTTLYAALQELNNADVKIITAENPVEYVISGINQAQVKTAIEMTFSRILRSMLRQAPNIILVGEIRDNETAEIAIEAALTGHLVFSTVHTNDAPSTITRLLDMGVKPFLVASSIQAIMSQRLVRILCPECKEKYEPSDVELKMLGLNKKTIGDRYLCRPVGCDKCNNTGFHGRKGIFELLELNSEIRELAFNKAPTIEIKKAAINSGMVTLLEDGVQKILDGITTIPEVLGKAKRVDITY